MLAASRRLLWLCQCALLPLVYSTSIADIQGSTFRSPLEGQTVQGVTGVVTGKVRAQLDVRIGGQ